jgi:predicted ATPase with chaperone activity
LPPIPLPADRELLGKAADALRLSTRAYHRTLKVARTIADLDGAGGVKRIYLARLIGISPTTRTFSFIIISLVILYLHMF